MKKFYLHIPELPGFQPVFAEMIDRMYRSQLIDAVDEVIFCVNGVLANVEIAYLPLLPVSDKFRVAHVNGDASKWEYPTINLIKQEADASESIDFVGYAHLKGLSRPDDLNAVDWRHYLTYWTVDRWEENIEKLNEGYEAVGVNWMDYPWPHFSGNFWWASTNYIRRLPHLVDPTKITMGVDSTYLPNVKLDSGNFRFEHEAWIGSATPNHYQLHASPGGKDGTFHYRFPYPESNYK